jgi:Fe-S-cluster containining protein
MLGVMPRDAHLVEIVDAAIADAARRSGAWVACKPGCTPCCLGPFPITQLDALRLRDGLRNLHLQDPARAARVGDRARQSAARLAREFPIDTLGRVLDEDDAAADEPCPALDPATGLCDLYDSRPITCRAFGPAVRWGSDAVGACELCYAGVTGEQIAQCRVEIDPGGLEALLLDELERTAGLSGQTIVAFALTASPTDPDPDPPRVPPRS